MKAILLAALQIFLLLLKAYFSRNDNNQEYRDHLAKAQAELDKIAEIFEQKLRFSNIPPQEVENLQKQLDQEEGKHGTHSKPRDGH